jgi:hypothetical protein
MALPEIVRIGMVGLFCALESCAQTCTILAPSNCGTAGVYTGPPTIQSFVTGVSTSLPGVLAGSARSPQPRLVYSGEIVAASQSFMASDPHSCPASGTCLFNNPTVIDNWIDSLVNAPPNGVGLASVDLNLWVSPLLQSVQYNPSGVVPGGLNYCGAYGVCYGSGSDSGWYLRGLGTYDQVFAHLAAKAGVKVRAAPMLSSDTLATCGISTGTGNFTELQVEQCAIPLWAAMAQRWHIDDFTVIHEPCGVFAEVMDTGPNCALSVPDLDTFIQHAAAAVRAASQNPNIRIGAGALISETGGPCPGSQNYWCDWYTNLSNVLDFFGLDIYPSTADPSSVYDAHLASYPPIIAPVLALGKPVVANESSGFRWAPLEAGEGEAGTYWGCGASEWHTDGTQQAWSRAVPGAWAPANGVSLWSIFPTEDLMLLSTDPNNTHCLIGDGFEANLSAALSNGTLLSPAGSEYAVVAAGWNTSLQGNAHLTGNAHLGH